MINRERRITRHVKGRTHTMLAICHPAISDLALAELKELGFQAEEQAAGVLAFESRIEDIYRVHLQSRLVTAFRIRLADFRCGTREDLFRRLRAFPWEYWLEADTPFQIKLSSRASRIAHDGRARESAYKAISGRCAEFFEKHPPEKHAAESQATKQQAKEEQSIYVHLSGSRALVSLDASAALLYKRGYAIRQGKAPLRENLAAAIIRAAPFTLTVPLVDAMSGSGCFLGEGILSYYGLWPLPQRPFAFEQWPVYNPQSLKTLRKRLNAENAERLAHRSNDNNDNAKFYAVEQDPSTYPLLRENLQAFSRMYLPNSSECITPVEQNFFPWIKSISAELKPEAGTEAKTEAEVSGTILCNPSYGWRLKKSPYGKLWKLFEETLPHWQGIVLMPLTDQLPGTRARAGSAGAESTDQPRTLGRAGSAGAESTDQPRTLGRAGAESTDQPRTLGRRSSWRDFPHGGKWIRAVYIRGVPHI